MFSGYPIWLSSATTFDVVTVDELLAPLFKLLFWVAEFQRHRPSKTQLNNLMVLASKKSFYHKQPLNIVAFYLDSI